MRWLALPHELVGSPSRSSCIKLARAMETWNLAWMEDMVPWEYTELLKQITESTTTPILTGEDIYLKESFIKLISAGAIDMIHPDLASSGGLVETKKIGDYAMEHGVAMAMHFAGTPISFMANVHCAAATENFVALEHHSLDVPWWDSLVRTTSGLPYITSKVVGAGEVILITSSLDESWGNFSSDPGSFQVPLAGQSGSA